MKYRVIRSSRKSLCITIEKDNEIIVRCPKNASDEIIEKFVMSKREWIEKITAKNSSRLSANDDILEYRQIYVCGEKFPLSLSDKDEITSSGVFVKQIKNIEKLYIKNFSADFIAFAENLAREYSFKTSGFSFRRYKRRWGCCNRNGKIVFNFILLMLPFELQRYVLVHELCHTVHFDHSKQFWSLVSRFDPDYKAKRRELGKFDFLINLY